jgi:hypothetical protein
LAQTGYIDSILEAAVSIDFGRKGFAVRGREQEGRVAYERGIAEASSTFKKAQATTDPQILILVEYTFISQELQLCPENDKDTLNSLTAAVQGFDDAFLALEVVENSISYKEAEKTYPHHKDYRVSGFPNDSFHVACKSHKTRLQNILRAPGIDPIEKDLLKQRIDNLSTAQIGYINKQKKVLEI